MAIAGVEAVENVNVKILEFDFASQSLIQVGTKKGLPSEELYSREQVREILIKFIHGLEPDDLDSIGFMYGHNLIDKAKSTEVGVVDEFMESDGEE